MTTQTTDQTIQILGIESKVGQSGKQYWSVNTNLGKMSCFEKSVIDALTIAFNSQTQIAVKIADDGRWKNIRGIVQQGNIVNNGQPINTYAQPQNLVQQVPQETVVKPSIPNKNTTMYVSYVKDLVISGNSVDDAIETIKIAKEAFE